MNAARGLRDLGPVDVARLSGVVQGLGEPAWNLETSRQDTYSVHKRTRAILFRLPTGIGHRYEDQVAWGPWRDLVMPVIRAAVRSFGYGRGDFSNAMLASLPGHSSIDEHTDEGLHFAKTHRIHVPVRTHTSVIMRIAGVPHHLEFGHAYEVDNLLPHAVDNPSDIDRVHLIFDYFDAGLDAGV